MKGNIASINHLLKLHGRSERLVRGKGYVYVVGGVSDVWMEQGIYGTNLAAITLNKAIRIVESKFAENGTHLTLAHTSLSEDDILKDLRDLLCGGYEQL